MYNYSAFGLQIQSDFRLPSLTPAEGAPDLIIRRGAVEQPELSPGLFGLSFKVTPETVYLRWRTIGDFRMHAGREITVNPEDGVSEHVLQGFIIGSGLGSILHQRGQLVLHASAVAGPHGAAAFIGESGWGKSTLAASFHARGYRMVADDLVVVHQVDGTPTIYPGMPEFKLWPDTIASLGESGEALPEVYPGQEKRVRRVEVDLQQGAATLQKLYLLDYGDTHEIVPLSPAEAAIALVSHTYGVEVFHAIAPRDHFIQCTELVKTVPVCRLRRKMAFEHLPALISLIEDDLQS